jgi:hypothetical protein
MEKRESNKVFVLGSGKRRGVDSAGWFDDLGNLADYDHVLLTTGELAEDVKDWVDWSNPLEAAVSPSLWKIGSAAWVRVFAWCESGSRESSRRAEQ